MSNYLFSLTNYHAVQQATIKLNGITVLAGVNGSGKSTIARLLHRTVETMTEFDSIVEEEGYGKFLRLMDKINRLTKNFHRNEKASRLAYITNRFSFSRKFQFSVMHDYFNRAIDLLKDVLMENLAIANEAELQRYCNYLGVEPNRFKSAQELTEAALSRLIEQYYQIEQECKEKMETRSTDDFFDQISSEQDVDIADRDLRDKLKFKEDGENLITSKSFKSPLGIKNVVYINTQYLDLSGSYYDDLELNKFFTKRREVSGPIKELISDLQNIIGGDVVAEAGFSNRYQLVRKNGQSFDLRGAATGELSFSYVLQLVKNGWIDQETLLIIDEPESHLHPQWIVDYARILVLLNKNLGTKVLISSHNPDMVSAIQSIAEAYGVLEQTNFYNAEKASEEGNQYVYEPLGSNIERIFDSFNIAIDRINLFSS